ncbi:unnamed protein product [Rhizopus stolonifer]
MPIANYIAWSIYAGLSFLLGSISLGFIKHYQSKQRSEWQSTLLSVICITLALVVVSLIPLDIFLVSNTTDRHTGLKKNWADEETMRWITLCVQILYYVFYSMVLVFTFFVIPYVMKGIKTSSLFGISGTILFLSGLFLKSHVPPHYGSEWYRNLLSENNGAKAFWFIVGCLFIPGMIFSIIYTAPGLSLVPFELFKKRKLITEQEDLQRKLLDVRERKRLIEQEYGTSSADDTLEDQERLILRHLSTIEQENNSLLQTVLRWLRPFKMMIGVMLLLFTFLLTTSIFVTIIDKIVFSICGIRCGYIIGQTALFNPINFILVHLVFPLDFALFVVILLYIFASTAMAISRMGYSFLWATLYRIKKHSTAPQGLILTATVLMISLLTLTYTITSELAPGYTHFGSQVYCNHTQGGKRDCTYHADKIYPCDIWAPAEICTPTVTSTLVDRMVLDTPFIGLILYYSQWIFLVSFALGLLVALFKSPRREDEEQGLLDTN